MLLFTDPPNSPVFIYVSALPAFPPLLPTSSFFPVHAFFNFFARFCILTNILFQPWLASKLSVHIGFPLSVFQFPPFYLTGSCHSFSLSLPLTHVHTHKQSKYWLIFPMVSAIQSASLAAAMFWSKAPAGLSWYEEKDRYTVTHMQTHEDTHTHTHIHHEPSDVQIWSQNVITLCLYM